MKAGRKLLTFENNKQQYFKVMLGLELLYAQSPLKAPEGNWKVETNLGPIPQNTNYFALPGKLFIKFVVLNKYLILYQSPKIYIDRKC